MLEAHVNINPVLNQFGSAYSSDILAMLAWLSHVATEADRITSV